MNTHFAPPEREGPDVWSRQAASVASDPVVSVLLGSLGGHLVVLNGKRQVVAANPAFLALLGVADLEARPGLRLGELLGCRNAALEEGGCGTSAFCPECGAVLAILEAFDSNLPVEKECHLCAWEGGIPTAREYRVKATPLVLGGEAYLVITFSDISAQKRREFLERIFVHDLRNLLGGLMGFGDLMTLQSGDKAAGAIVRLSKLLNAEIEAQILLTRAESGDYQTRVEDFPADRLFADLAELFQEHACARDRRLLVAPGAPTRVRGDRTVVLRILVNMVKNAFEASAPGQRVTLGVEARPGGWRFTVHNVGVMEPAVARRVFERTFTTKDQPGRGLGTYAMRLFAEGYLGGQVGFTSLEGEGTTFFLDLPDQSGTTPGRP